MDCTPSLQEGRVTEGSPEHRNERAAVRRLACHKGAMKVKEKSRCSRWRRQELARKASCSSQSSQVRLQEGHACCLPTSLTSLTQDWPYPCPAQTADTELGKALSETSIQVAKHPRGPTQSGALECSTGVQSEKACREDTAAAVSSLRDEATPADGGTEDPAGFIRVQTSRTLCFLGPVSPFPFVPLLLRVPGFSFGATNQLQNHGASLTSLVLPFNIKAGSRAPQYQGCEKKHLGPKIRNCDQCLLWHLPRSISVSEASLDFCSSLLKNMKKPKTVVFALE